MADIEIYKRSFIPEDDEESFLLERDGVKLLPCDCSSVIIGERHSGKSQAADVLMAAVLGDKSFGFTNSMKNNKVVYIDTYFGGRNSSGNYSCS